MPAKTSAVGSAVDGRVVEYPIDIGVRVAKGDPLCRLLTETISLQIAAAEAELRLRQEELRELKNGTRPEEVAQARARMEAAIAVDDFAQSRFKRAEQLVQQGRTLTQEQLEEYQSASITAARNLHSTEQEYQMLVKGPREETVAQAVARVDAQGEMVQQLRDQLRKHTMIAPFDGYVVAKKTEVGEWVTRGQVVAEVVLLDEVEVEAYVLDAQIDAVRLGMEARVEVAALAEPLYLGQVVRISPQADVKSRTFPVKVRVKNVIREDGPVLKAGMLGRVTLPVGQQREALLVPKDAIVFGGPSPMVYVVGPAPPPPAGAVPGGAPAGKPPVAGGPPAEAPALVVKPVPVELGIAQGTWISVKAPLTKEDQVVVLGNERLRPGAPVVILREWADATSVEPAAKP
jgi:multidrug efflux pump subunit AcrA (membrane-fusion protein)